MQFSVSDTYQWTIIKTDFDLRQNQYEQNDGQTIWDHPMPGRE